MKKKLVAFIAALLLAATATACLPTDAKMGPQPDTPTGPTIDAYTFIHQQRCDHQKVTGGWLDPNDLIINAPSGSGWTIDNCVFDQFVKFQSPDATVITGYDGNNNPIYAPNPNYIPPSLTVNQSKFNSGFTMNSPFAGVMQWSEVYRMSVVTDYPLWTSVGDNCPGRTFPFKFVGNWIYQEHARWDDTVPGFPDTNYKPHTEAFHVYGACPSGLYFEGNHFAQQGPYQWPTATGSVNIQTANSTFLNNVFEYTADSDGTPLSGPTANYTLTFFGPGNDITGGCVANGMTGYILPGKPSNDPKYNPTLDPYPAAPHGGTKDCVTNTVLWP